MKTTLAVLAAVLVSIAWVVAAQPAGEARAGDPAGEMAGAGNRFGLRMYKELAGEKGNVFFSPGSIHAALAMTAEGAKGDTRREMTDVLGWSKDAIRVRFKSGGRGTVVTGAEVSNIEPAEAYKELLEKLRPGKDAGYQLNVANALWGQKGYAWLPGFLKTTKDNYGAGLREVDFAKATEDARQTINGWVEQQTKDKIKDLLAKGVLTGDTRLVLTNAIYFKGNWADEFDKKATKDAPFHLTADKAVQAPLMERRGHYGYAEDSKVQVLSIPYKGNELSMVVVLPKAVDGLAAVEKDLNAIKLEGYLARLRRPNVQVFLPRFKTTCQFELNKVLQAMGMVDAFAAGKADFSGMDGKKDLFISAVIHKAFVEVNEEGTEAAAATAIAVALAMAEPEPEPVFRADHPFLFLIRHNATGAILFMGRLSDPKG